MLLYKLILPLLILILSLQSCGFSPVYGKKSESLNEQMAITNLDIKVGRTQLDNIFKNTMEDTLNPTHEKGAALYTFTAGLKTSSSYLSILQNANITSYQVSVVINYTLTENNSHKVIRKGTLTRQAQFNRSLSEYSTFVSEEKAKENAVKSLAQDLSIIITSSVMAQEKKNSTNLHINENSSK